MLEVEGLTKRFGGVHALDGVSFSIGEGEIVGLLGPNGAGKTTTLRILAGALSPTGGTVRIGHYDLTRDPLYAKRKVGYLPEQLPIDAEMRVAPFLHYVGRLRGLTGRERKDAVARVMEACALTQVANRPVGTLSRGFRLRVGLAQAMVHNPEILLLDEPTAGLDPAQVLRMRELIRSLAGNHTILFSSHNLTEVAATCSRVLLLKDGKVALADDVGDLVGESRDEVRLLFRFAAAPADVSERVAAFPGVVRTATLVDESLLEVWLRRDAPVVREGLIRHAVENGWGICEIREDAGTLDAIVAQYAEAAE